MLLFFQKGFVMKILKIIALALCVVLPGIVCWAAQENYFQLNIDRVFMHLPGDYSVAYTGMDKVVTIERLIWEDPLLPPEFRIKTWIMSKSKNWISRPDIKSGHHCRRLAR